MQTSRTKLVSKDYLKINHFHFDLKLSKKKYSEKNTQINNIKLFSWKTTFNKVHLDTGFPSQFGFGLTFLVLH